MGASCHTTMATQRNVPNYHTTSQVDEDDEEDIAFVRSLSVRNYPIWVPLRFHQWWLSYVAILVWYGFNMTLVLSGKFIFATLKPPPAFLTTLHVITGFVLSSVILYMRKKEGKPETIVEKISKIREFAGSAIFFALNIYLSNLCTQLSSNASFTAAIKALTPVVTFFLYLAINRRAFTKNKLMQLGAIMVVIGGVLLNASSDDNWSYSSLAVGLGATVCCSLMAITQTAGLQKNDPMEALNAQAPTVIACVATISVFTESDRVALWIANAEWSSIAVLQCHGLLAFCLNIVGGACAGVTKPVQKTIFGNLKVAFIYGLECCMWQVCVGMGLSAWCIERKLNKTLEFWTILSCLIIFVGAMVYGYLYEQEKNVAANFENKSKMR